ncbi:pumillio RNA binding protein 4, putative [Trypanosoma brucei gambiense DAL972]|uniref:Pumillio RNA binding protein 4, putative n=1 Tax=Trypanosoma brucei gambiense (strain MHOM/CI/86/DAL972) TaxID=679716 RepID=C9ZQ99_TRYB9|nr:pumillio RNA binding protein 4, putative [Trypanosoma brucei gambiense DAL972]CBH11579.1 pumillio RNA binding protein 4, putative [Trypanosoma brucei gambiense DAL972]|eukprot:XP_011773864.1 pumillio RNA binding protein 4, putative [Trypanosoma brucei gambiense DAL972]
MTTMEEENITSKLSTLLAQVAAVEAARELEARRHGCSNINISDLTMEASAEVTGVDGNSGNGKGCATAMVTRGGGDEFSERIWERRHNASLLGGPSAGNSPMDVKQCSLWGNSPPCPRSVGRPVDDNTFTRSIVGATTSLEVSPLAPEGGLLMVEGSSTFTPCAYRRRSCQHLGEPAEGSATTPSVSPTSVAAGLTPSVYSARATRSESAHGAAISGVAAIAAAAAANSTTVASANANNTAGITTQRTGEPLELAGDPSPGFIARLDWGDAVDQVTGGETKDVHASRSDAHCLNEAIGGINLLDELSPLCTPNTRRTSGRWGSNLGIRPTSDSSYSQLAHPERLPPQESDLLLGGRSAGMADYQRQQQHQKQGLHDTYPLRSGQPYERFTLSSAASGAVNRNPIMSHGSRNNSTIDMMQTSGTNPNRRISFMSGSEHQGKGWSGEKARDVHAAFADPTALLRAEEDADALMRLATKVVHHRHYSSHPVMQQRDLNVTALAGSMMSENGQSAAFTASGSQNSHDAAARSRAPVQMPLHGGRIVKLAADQQGCRMLQSVLERFPFHSSEVQKVISELLPVLTDVMKDPYGNFLVQKLLEVAPDEERMRLLDYHISASLCDVAISPHGNYAVQKLIDSLRSSQEVQVVCRALQRGTLQLMTDLNGGHVIQKLLQCISQKDLTFLYDVIVKDTVDVCNDKHGCCVVQKCMDHAINVHLQRTQKAILRHMLQLSLNPYGNYVVTHLISMCNSQSQRHVVNEAAHCAGPALELLCANKFASNVVEKIVRGCAPSAKLELCRFLFNRSTINTGMSARLMGMDYVLGEQDPQQRLMIQPAAAFVTPYQENTALEAIVLNSYGNYVVQTMLDVLPISPELAQLLFLLHKLSPEIMKHNFGKRIASKMEQARERIITHLQERGVNAGEADLIGNRYTDRLADVSRSVIESSFHPNIPMDRPATNYNINGSGTAGETPQMKPQEVEIIKALLASLGSFAPAPPPPPASAAGSVRGPLADVQRAVDVISGPRSNKRKQTQRGRKG